MRRYFFALLLLAVSRPAAAQVGEIGMPMWRLTASLGAPARVDRVDREKPWFFRGLDEVWYYRGRTPGTSFSYGITEGRITSTHATLLLQQQEEARRWAASYAEAMQRRGWKPGDERASDSRLLYSSRKVFSIEIIPLQQGYGVVLSQAIRDDSTSARPSAEALLRFHTEQAATLAVAPAIPQAVTATSDRPAFAASREREAPPAEKPVQPGGVAPRSVTPSARVLASADERPRHDTSQVGRSRVPSPSPPRPALPRASGEVGKAGGYTWVVASLPTPGEAAARAAQYRAAGYDGFAIPGHSRGRVVYRVGIGMYPALDELRAARNSLPPDAPSDAWILRLEAGTLVSVVDPASSE
jgi:hypothetical protein